MMNLGLINFGFRTLAKDRLRKKQPESFVTYTVALLNCCKKNFVAKKAKEWRVGPMCPLCQHRVRDWKSLGRFFAASEADAIQKARAKLRENRC